MYQLFEKSVLSEMSFQRGLPHVSSLLRNHQDMQTARKPLSDVRSFHCPSNYALLMNTLGLQGSSYDQLSQGQRVNPKLVISMQSLARREIKLEAENQCLHINVKLRYGSSMWHNREAIFSFRLQEMQYNLRHKDFISSQVTFYQIQYFIIINFKIKNLEFILKILMNDMK